MNNGENQIKRLRNPERKSNFLAHYKSIFISMLIFSQTKILLKIHEIIHVLEKEKKSPPADKHCLA